MTMAFAVCTVLFLSYANGANDNFKGVATLFGSGTTDYRRALLWGTVTTAAGSLLALLFAQGLLASTTHVSCGSLFGIGTVTRQARWDTIAGILAAWVTTLPVAALLGAMLFLLLHRTIG